jgi:hypothetical protein
MEQSVDEILDDANGDLAVGELSAVENIDAASILIRNFSMAGMRSVWRS